MGEEGEGRTLGPDEVYCTSCGEVIKEEAVICPHCGVRQKPESESQTDTVQEDSSGLPEQRRYELQKLARKSKPVTAILGFLISPVGYLMVGRTGLAIINLLTANYLLFGFIIVPIHTWRIISNAREELRAYGVDW